MASTGNFGLVTICMEQSPSWKAASFSGSQKISSILLNRKVHRRFQKNPITDRCDQILNSVMNIWVRCKAWNFVTNWTTTSFARRILVYAFLSLGVMIKLGDSASFQNACRLLGYDTVYYVVNFPSFLPDYTVSHLDDRNLSSHRHQGLRSHRHVSNLKTRPLWTRYCWEFSNTTLPFALQSWSLLSTRRFLLWSTLEIYRIWLLGCAGSNGYCPL
jgi:hypothetical protein